MGHRMKLVGALDAPPVVWVMLSHRVGDSIQVMALANALGWPYEVKSATPDGGSSTAGIPGHTVIYPSYGYFGKKGVIQSAYAFGRVATTLGEMSLDEQVEQAIERTETIHPGQFRKHYDGKAFSVAWHRTKHNEGGWTQWSPRDREQHLPVLREPQGRVYFAGDYLSGLAGWQVGAIESAWTQIEKVHATATAA